MRPRVRWRLARDCFCCPAAARVCYGRDHSGALLAPGSVAPRTAAAAPRPRPDARGAASAPKPRAVARVRVGRTVKASTLENSFQAHVLVGGVRAYAYLFHTFPTFRRLTASVSSCNTAGPLQRPSIGKMDSLLSSGNSSIPAVPESADSRDMAPLQDAPIPFHPTADVHPPLGGDALVALPSLSSALGSEPGGLNLSAELSGMLEASGVFGGNAMNGAAMGDSVPVSSSAPPLVFPSTVPQSSAPVDLLTSSPQPVAPAQAPRPPPFQAPWPTAAGLPARPRPDGESDSSSIVQDRSRPRRAGPAHHRIDEPLLSLSPAPAPLPPSAIPRGLPLVPPVPAFFPYVEQPVPMTIDAENTPPSSSRVPITIGRDAVDEGMVPGRHQSFMDSVPPTGRVVDVSLLNQQIDGLRQDVSEHTAALGQAASENRALSEALATTRQSELLSAQQRDQVSKSCEALNREITAVRRQEATISTALRQEVAEMRRQGQEHIHEMSVQHHNSLSQAQLQVEQLMTQLRLTVQGSADEQANALAASAQREHMLRGEVTAEVSAYGRAARP